MKFETLKLFGRLASLSGSQIRGRNAKFLNNGSGLETTEKCNILKKLTTEKHAKKHTNLTIQELHL